MDDIQSIHLRRLHGRLGEVVYELSKVSFSQFSSPKVWQPAVNVYRCTEGIAICVDLAGVDRDRIEVQAEPRRLLIRGFRQPPEPEGADQTPVQVLVMEIDYGRFEREIVLPCDVEPDKVTAEQRNGLLWVYLPLRCQA
ncbi:MAG: Hsp20/alpha crystallin family protein [Verrucomicrobiia bacterium]